MMGDTLEKASSGQELNKPNHRVLVGTIHGTGMMGGGCEGGKLMLRRERGTGGEAVHVMSGYKREHDHSKIAEVCAVHAVKKMR